MRLRVVPVAAVLGVLAATAAFARSYSCNVVVFGVGPDGRAFEAGGSVFASTCRARTGQAVTLDPAYVRGPISR